MTTPRHCAEINVQLLKFGWQGVIKFHFRLAYLDSCQYGVGFAHDAHHNTTLLDGLLCVLDLEDTTLGRAIAPVSLIYGYEPWLPLTMSPNRCRNYF